VIYKGKEGYKMGIIKDGERSSDMTRKNLVMEMIVHLKEVYRIGKELGYDNILEKAKWKEEYMGMVLGDTVFPNSTGEVGGADAINDKSAQPREYKTGELKDPKEKERFLKSVVDGTATYAGSMTYNGGSTREAVNSYKPYGHFHGVFYRGDLLAIADISPEYVTSDAGLMKRIIKQEKGKKYKSTNGNGVAVHYENGDVRENEGKLVYLNDIRK